MGMMSTAEPVALYAEKRQRMGATGHDFVREHFLLMRQLRDHLTMLLRVSQRSNAPAA